MTNGVVLTAALRSNLLSLQQTQKDIDVHQNRLATGKKVNSALDNPQAFFAAQALTDRANDLSNLLDSIGQSIQVINAANNGVTALTTLINQAQSIANSAQSTLAGSSTQATVTGTADLGTGKLTSTIPGLSTGDFLTFTITDPNGGANLLTNQSISALTANDTAADLVTRINDLNTALSTQAISASLDASNHLVLTAVNGGSLYVKFSTNANSQAANQGSANAFGFSAIEKYNQQGSAGGNEVSFTQLATSTVSSKGLYSAANTIATASTLLTNVRDSTYTQTYVSLGNSAGTFQLSVGGKTSGNLFAATPNTTTIQNIIDNVNNDATIKSLVSASFDGTTGKIVLSPLTGSATDVQTILKNNATATTQTLNLFGIQSTATGGVANNQATEDIRFGAAAGTLASLQTQYNTTLDQIDALVGDTGYAGTNLLNGNDLTTYFNESRTSSLSTSGVTFNAAGLDLDAGNFQSSASITTSINQTIAALTTVRNFGSTLANNLSIIQNRQDFTNNLINTLKTGSDALTNADQNEEGASLLALQTRQSLGITSLSLASQAQQAILKLF